MNNPRLTGRTSWFAAFLIAAGFVVVKLNVFGAGDFVRSNGPWAAVIGLTIFAAIVAISVFVFAGNQGGDKPKP